jgi:hypothetical protein
MQGSIVVVISEEVPPANNSCYLYRDQYCCVKRVGEEYRPEKGFFQRSVVHQSIMEKNLSCRPQFASGNHAAGKDQNG